MRNFSNQQGGRHSGGNSSRHSDNRGGGHRSHGGGSHHDQRGGGYRGNGQRQEQRYGGNREGGRREGSRPSSGGYRGDRGERPYPRHESSERRESHSAPHGGGGRGGSWVEIEGRSVEEALEEACRRFNVNKNDLNSEVVEGGSKGFLGIGSKPAKVKISLKNSAVSSFADGVLSRLLRGMSLPDKVQARKDEDGNIVLNIQGPSSGTLIGRHGHTLEALQYLVSKVVQRMTGDERSIVIVDVENYLERQKDKLKELALSLAQKAKETGVEIPMRPMSSKDRRVVHLALKDHEHVTTESRGEGLRRKVVIVPKVRAEEKAAAPAENTEAAATPEPGNVAPPEAHVEAPSMAPAAEVEPGNAVPPEKQIDDDIGNRV